MRIKLTGLALSLPVLILLGCAEAQAIPTPDIPATVDAQVERRLAETPTITPMPRPTNRPAPTPTATHAATPTPSPTPSPAPSPTPSADAVIEGILESVVWVTLPDADGTGFVFDSDGSTSYILTTHHVIENGGEVWVEDASGHMQEAALVGYDGNKDIAVLSVCCDPLRVAPLLERPETIAIGSEVFSVGYALAMKGAPTVTRGIVSAIRHDESMDALLIQTDAAINSGQSGGPLIDRQGRVIGLNAFVRYGSEEADAQELSFAVSVGTIKNILPQLMGGARIEPPAPAPTHAPQTGWLTFSNNEHGWTIDYPGDWEVDDADSSSVEFSSPNGFADLAVVVADWEFVSAADEIDMLIEHHLAKDLLLFEVIRTTSRTYEGGDNDGDNQADVHYRYQRAEEFCVEERWAKFLEIAARGYVLRWHSCAHALDEDEHYRPVIEQMTESFTVR